MLKTWRAILMCSAIVATAGYAADSQVTPVPAGVNAPPFGPGEEQLIAPPSIAQHYDWYFRPDDTERNHPGFLAYEATDTDDQVLYFVCEEGGQRIFAGINSAHANIKTLTLTAADQTLHLNGKFDKSEEMPGLLEFTSEEIPGQSPLMQAFAASGTLNMQADNGYAANMVGSSDGKKAISDFIAHCNRPYGG